MKAAISAVGVVSAHGIGIEPLRTALRAGRSGIRVATRFDTAGMCSTLAAEAPVETSGDRALELLKLALTDAFGERRFTPSKRRAALLGTTKGSLPITLERRGDDPIALLTAQLARAVEARGPVRAVGAACASSSAALGEAFELIANDLADEVVVAGVEALHPFVYAGFHALKALSPTPAAPFDAKRTGLSMGEGAAVLLVERAPSNAPFAWVEGFGAATDGHDQTAPHPAGDGLKAACLNALERAGCGLHAVGRYHAHGTATPHNDRMEAAVCKALFGARGIPVTAVKGSLGHTLGAAGVLDVVSCALQLNAKELWPVAGLTEVDPRLEVAPVQGPAQPHDNPLALVATAGFGGINTALVVRAGAAR